MGKLPIRSSDSEGNAPQDPQPREERKKIVVVGLGMVGIAFM